MLNRTAFDELVEATYRSMYRLAYRLVGNYDDAEEIVQEAYLKAWKSRGKFRGESSGKTWIYRIVVNTALSLRRQWTRRRKKLAGFFFERRGEGPTTGEGIEDQMVQLQMNCRLNAALQDLPPMMRAMVVLRDVEGMAYEDIAGILGVPVGTVKSRLWRARHRLRNVFIRRMGEPSDRPFERRRKRDGLEKPVRSFKVDHE